MRKIIADRAEYGTYIDLKKSDIEVILNASQSGYYELFTNANGEAFYFKIVDNSGE